MPPMAVALTSSSLGCFVQFGRFPEQSVLLPYDHARLRENRSETLCHSLSSLSLLFSHHFFFLLRTSYTLSERVKGWTEEGLPSTRPIQSSGYPA